MKKSENEYNKRLCLAYQHCLKSNKVKSTRVIQNLLLTHNLKTISKLSKAFLKGKSFVDIEDLISEGSFGLLRAAETYRVDKNTVFSTYAYFYIARRIRNYMVESRYPVSIPAHVDSIDFESFEDRDFSDLVDTNDLETSLIKKNIEDHLKKIMQQELLPVDYLLVHNKFFKDIPISQTAQENAIEEPTAYYYFKRALSILRKKVTIENKELLGIYL